MRLCSRSLALRVSSIPRVTPENIIAASVKSNPRSARVLARFAGSKVIRMSYCIYNNRVIQGCLARGTGSGVVSSALLVGEDYPGAKGKELPRTTKFFVMQSTRERMTDQALIMMEIKRALA